MLIHSSVCSYYDWAPVPEGTQITEADVTALRVKQMTNDSWHMRVDVERDTHNDANIPELAICDRMASLELLGRPQSREATVAEIMTGVYRHHLSPKHIESISVHDSGPDRDLYVAELARQGITDPDRVDAALAEYLDGADVETYLNVVFKTKSSRSAAPSKETP